MERVVDRSELLSEASTAPSSPDLSGIATLDRFEFTHITMDTTAESSGQGNVQDVEHGLDFQLFAPITSKTESVPAVAKIRLDTPEASITESGFINPRREDAYYFKGAATNAEMQSYEAAARSGQEILLGAQSRWPGMAYPWKLLNVSSTRKQRLLLTPSDSVYSKLQARHPTSKHKRPGKKARIAKRVKAAAIKAKQDEAQEAAIQKQAAEQEKRTRRNREKKVKKKNREKAKKAEAGTPASVEGAEMAGSVSDANAD